MENFNFAMSDVNKRNINPAENEKKIELSGPSLRIFNATKKELGSLFGFGLRNIDEDAELMVEINRHFLENEGVMRNKVREWEAALMDVNKNAARTESDSAKNFANRIFEFITKESKIKDRFNN